MLSKVSRVSTHCLLSFLFFYSCKSAQSRVRPNTKQNSEMLCGRCYRRRKVRGRDAIKSCCCPKRRYDDNLDNSWRKKEIQLSQHARLKNSLSFSSRPAQCCERKKKGERRMGWLMLTDWIRDSVAFSARIREILFGYDAGEISRLPKPAAGTNCQSKPRHSAVSEHAARRPLCAFADAAVSEAVTDYSTRVIQLFLLLYSMLSL